MKNTFENIIILHKCTKNHDHMLYCCQVIAHDRCNGYFSFWAIFCPFTAQKIIISKKWKKHLEISSFYTSVPKIMTGWCTVPESDGQTDRQKKWHTEVGAPPKKPLLALKHILSILSPIRTL